MYRFVNEHEITPYRGENIEIRMGGGVVTIIANPSEDQLRLVGFKHLRDLPAPEVKESEIAEFHYEQSDYEIVKVWEVRENPNFVPEERTADDDIL